MWIVVETVEEENIMVSAVPTSWVNDGVVFWPVKLADQNNGRQHQIEPQKNWTRHACKVLSGNIYSWKEAREQEDVFSKYSSKESADEAERVKALRKKHPVKASDIMLAGNYDEFFASTVRGKFILSNIFRKSHNYYTFFRYCTF